MRDAARTPFLGLGHWPTVSFTSPLTLRSFPTHDTRGNCLTASSSFCPARKLRRRGRAPESIHDPSGLQNTRVPLSWHRARPGNVMSHVKCDRSCRRAYVLLYGRTQATSGSVAGARPGATFGALDQGVPAPTTWSAQQKVEDKNSLSGSDMGTKEEVKHNFRTPPR
jgi:hypothetical protein